MNIIKHPFYHFIPQQTFFVHFSHRFLLVSDIAIIFTVNGKRLQYLVGGSRKALESFLRKGKKVAIMCADGNTPTREAHIVRKLNPLENPWFFFDGDECVFWISVFHFKKMS